MAEPEAPSTPTKEDGTDKRRKGGTKKEREGAKKAGADILAPKSPTPYAVVIGEAPALEGVLLCSVKTPPFDLESFRRHCASAFCEEALDFYLRVEAFRRATNGDSYVSEAKGILETFVFTTASRQVNLSDRQRKATEARAAAALENAEKTGVPDLTVFDEAQAAILQMMERDQYAAYVNKIVVERNLRIAKADALWWKKDNLTLKEFFTFPSPVNAAESRLHNLSTCALICGSVALAYWANFPWILVYLTYGFLARTSCGPRLDPQAFLVLFVLRPILADRLGLLENKFVPGGPKRFAQLCGFMFSAMLLGFALGEVWIGVAVVAAMFLMASGLAAFLDVCVACIMFKWAAEKGLLGENVCKDCKLTYVANVKKTSARQAASGPAVVSFNEVPPSNV